MINAKQMAAAYYNTNCDNEIWLSFYTLVKAGVINRNTWDRFYSRCCGWTYDYEKGCVVDFNGEEVNL